jgi:hypothetical protein
MVRLASEKANDMSSEFSAWQAEDLAMQRQARLGSISFLLALRAARSDGHDAEQRFVDV